MNESKNKSGENYGCSSEIVLWIASYRQCALMRIQNASPSINLKNFDPDRLTNRQFMIAI